MYINFLEEMNGYREYEKYGGSQKFTIKYS